MSDSRSRSLLKTVNIIAMFAGSTPDDPDIEKCKPVTTEVMTENATATNPESGFDNQTQPTNGCPAGTNHAMTSY